MAPSNYGKTKKACKAMAVMGVQEAKVKAVLKKLLKTYDNEWDFIEDDDYKLLIETIFDENVEQTEMKKNEENKKSKRVAINSGKKKAVETQLVVKEEEEEETDEDEVQLKRRPRTKRERNCDYNPSLSLGSPMLKKTRVEEPKHLEEENGNCGMTELPPLKRYLRRTSGKGSGVTIITRGKSDGKEVVQKALHYSDAANCSSSVLKMEESVMSVNEQNGETKVTPNDITARYVPPSAVEESSEPKVNVALDLVASTSGAGNCSSHVLDTKESIILVEEQDGEAKGTGSDIAMVVPPSDVEESSEHKVASATLELASSTLGEAKICLSFAPADGETTTLHSPSMEDIRKAMEEKCLKSYKILDPSFSFLGLMNDVCSCYMDLAKNSTNQSLKTESVSGMVNAGNESGAADISMGLVVVPECGISADGWRAISNVNDITAGGEKIEIPWVNEFNDEVPSCFRYIPQSFVFRDAAVKVSVSSLSNDQCCLTCIGNCLDASGIPCKCTIPYRVDGVLKDDFLEERISEARDVRKQVLEFCQECPLEKAKKEEDLEPCKGHVRRKVIKECWIKCGCGKSCGNRVVQRGIHSKFEVFYTPNGKGWGLRTLERLPKGAFVCEYIGEVLTISELYQRSFEDKLSSPVILDAHWGSKDGLEDKKAMCLDGTCFGNISRFLNHRCLDANLIEIPVQIETPDQHYYHVAFFTTRDIEPMEELTRDYGIDFEDDDSPVKPFDCLCESRHCWNRKRSKKGKKLMIKA